MKTKLLVTFSLVLTINAYAGSATWNLNPATGDWSTAANWTPATVPNGPTDIATFDASNVSDVSLSANTEVSGVIFNPGAAAFTISPNPGTGLDITGTGVTNNSGVMQNFVATVDTNLNHGFIQFWNNATAGSSITYTLKAAPGPIYGGSIWFLGNSTAGSATFVNEGGAMPASVTSGGSLNFENNSSAAEAIVMNYGGTTEGANGGEISFGAVSFQSTATAANALIINYPATVPAARGGYVTIYQGTTGGDATFINNGASASGAGGGVTTFTGGSAGNSTLIANAGSNGGRGGEISFDANSVGGTSRVQVFGNGFLDTSNSNVAIGSLEGDGIVDLGANPLSIGSNSLSTVFSGLIRQHGLAIGSIIKIGPGTLTLTGASTYTGGTTVNAGRLLLMNRTGHVVGTGPVQVNAGTLAGNAKVIGAITIGTGSGSGAILAPAKGTSIGRLTTKNMLTFNADGTYSWLVRSDTTVASQVIANGVTIAGGAQFSAAGNFGMTLPSGTEFNVLSNTSANPISGTFANLADGATINVNGTNFQANYEGGDGNDLTLTVVQ